MNRVWAWVFSLVVGLCIIALLASVRAERRAYWVARGAVIQHGEGTLQPIDRLLQRR